MEQHKQLQLMYLNIDDCISMKEPKFSEIKNEVEFLLSNEIVNGRIDITKEHTLFLCTIYGAVNVTLIPKVH